MVGHDDAEDLQKGNQTERVLDRKYGHPFKSPSLMTQQWSLPKRQKQALKIPSRFKFIPNPVLFIPFVENLIGSLTFAIIFPLLPLPALPTRP